MSCLAFASLSLVNKCAWWRNERATEWLRSWVARRTLCFWWPTRSIWFWLNLNNVLYVSPAFTSSNFWKSDLFSVARCLSRSGGRKKPLSNRWFLANLMRWGASKRIKKFYKTCEQSLYWYSRDQKGLDIPIESKLITWKHANISGWIIRVLKKIMTIK